MKKYGLTVRLDDFSLAFAFHLGVRILMISYPLKSFSLKILSGKTTDPGEENPETFLQVGRKVFVGILRRA